MLYQTVVDAIAEGRAHIKSYVPEIEERYSRCPENETYVDCPAWLDAADCVDGRAAVGGQCSSSSAGLSQYPTRGTWGAIPTITRQAFTESVSSSASLPGGMSWWATGQYGGSRFPTKDIRMTWETNDDILYDCDATRVFASPNKIDDQSGERRLQDYEHYDKLCYCGENVEPPPCNDCEKGYLAGKWFSDVAYEKWDLDNLHSLSECNDVCMEMAMSECILRNAMLSGMKLRCGAAYRGYGGSTKQTYYCAALVGREMDLVDVDASNLEVSQEPLPTPILSTNHWFAADEACNVNLYSVEACAMTAEMHCDATHTNYGEVLKLCEEVGGLFYDDCVYDVCAYAGDTDWVDIAEINEEADELVQRASPPPPSPPIFPTACAADPTGATFAQAGTGMQPPMCYEDANGKQRCVVLSKGQTICDPSIQRRLKKLWGAPLKGAIQAS